MFVPLSFLTFAMILTARVPTQVLCISKCLRTSYRCVALIRNSLRYHRVPRLSVVYTFLHPICALGGPQGFRNVIPQPSSTYDSIHAAGYLPEALVATLLQSSFLRISRDVYDGNGSMAAAATYLRTLLLVHIFISFPIVFCSNI